MGRTAGVPSKKYAFTPDGKGQSTTFAARISDGKLLIISPGTGFTDTDFAEFGDIGVVVAPNGYHHLGVADWRKRFPWARFFARALAARRITTKSETAGTFEPVGGLQSLWGDNLSVTDAPAIQCGETWT